MHPITSTCIHSPRLVFIDYSHYSIPYAYTESFIQNK